MYAIRSYYVFLGEHGDAAAELEAIRRFRERRGALGVPLILVGGMNAFLPADTPDALVDVVAALSDG